MKSLLKVVAGVMLAFLCTAAVAADGYLICDFDVASKKITCKKERPTPGFQLAPTAAELADLTQVAADLKSGAVVANSGSYAQYTTLRVNGLKRVDTEATEAFKEYSGLSDQRMSQLVQGAKPLSPVEVEFVNDHAEIIAAAKTIKANSSASELSDISTAGKCSGWPSGPCPRCGKCH